jgi:20S proteasome alpha/beta subunit
MRPKPHRLVRPKFQRLRTESSVTIALGMKCMDGVLVAADRQITKEGGLKYQQDKILVGGTVVSSFTMDFALAYAGSPDLAKGLLNKVGMATLKVCEGNVFTPSTVQSAIEDVLTIKETRDLETIIIFGGPNISPFMLRTRETRVVFGTMEYIGAGDSSVLRYLADLIKFPLALERAKIVGAYLISVANRYIDGCGFGPDVAFIGMDGEVKRADKAEIDSYAEEFAELEKALTNTLGLL